MSQYTHPYYVCTHSGTHKWCHTSVFSRHIYTLKMNQAFQAVMFSSTDISFSGTYMWCNLLDRDFRNGLTLCNLPSQSAGLTSLSANCVNSRICWRRRRNIFDHTTEYKKAAWWTNNPLFLVAYLFLSWIIFQDMFTFYFLQHLYNYNLESVETVKLSMCILVCFYC